MTTAAAVPVVPAPAFHMLSLDALSPSPDNERKTFDKQKLAELVASIQARGVLQPILARPLAAGEYEIVCGHRRVRAAEAAGLKEIPAIVRQLDDKAAHEVRLIENLQREDLSPMEEARGYKALVKDHGYKVEELAAKIAKSVAYVYRRLKLCELAPGVQDALAAGDLSVAAAEEIARLPIVEHQLEVLHHAENFGEHTASDVRAHILSQFMLDLSAAPFDTQDAKLVAAAGACAACPKRTGSQKELFSDVKKGDACLDPKCFDTKKQAAWKLKAKEVQAKGGVLLRENQAESALNDTYGYSQFAKLSDKCPDDPKKRTYAELLGQHAPLVIAKHNGKEVRLVTKKDLPELLKKAGHAFQEKEDKEQQQAEASELAERKARLLREGAVELTIPLLVGQVEKKGLGKQVLLVLVQELLRQAEHGPTLIRRSGARETMPYPEQTKRLDAWQKTVPKMTEAELRGLLFEFVLETAFGDIYQGFPPPLVEACKALKVDLKAEEKRAKVYLDRELAARAKAEAAAPKKAS